MKATKRDARLEGQSLILIAAGMVAFLALVAIVVDAGNDYAQHLQLQNSTDAAVQARALTMATIGNTTGDLSDAIVRYVQANGSDLATGLSYFTARDGSGNNIGVTSSPVLSFGRNNPVPATLTFNGSCNETGLFPLALIITTFPDENGDGIRDVHYEQLDPLYTYQIFEKNGGWQTTPGNFGWLTWDGSPSATTLAANIADPSLSSSHNVGDNIQGSNGDVSSSGVRDNIQLYIDHNVPVKISVFDTVTGSGADTLYHIVGFARFHLFSIDTMGNPKSIKGKFMQWTSSSNQGGC